MYKITVKLYKINISVIWTVRDSFLFRIKLKYIKWKIGSLSNCIMHFFIQNTLVYISFLSKKNQQQSSLCYSVYLYTYIYKHLQQSLFNVYASIISLHEHIKIRKRIRKRSFQSWLCWGNHRVVLVFHFEPGTLLLFYTLTLTIPKEELWKLKFYLFRRKEIGERCHTSENMASNFPKRENQENTALVSFGGY